MVTFVPAFTHPDHERASVKDLVDHVEYIAARIGYDHIGVGSDLDGTAKIIEGITDAAGVPGLVVEMLKRGIARQDIEKMLGLNVIRVLKAVENAAKLMKDEVALEDKIAPVE
jgi:membrane dipeptidase